jgi:sugar (pentulose or hexulose) kinase
VLIWQDQRALDVCARVGREVGEDRYYDLTGLRLGPIASASKVAWLRTNDPGAWRQVRGIATAQAHALWTLGAGRLVAPRSMAAYVGLLDLRRGAWSDELTRAFGIAAALLPELVDEGAAVGVLSLAAARRTGLAAGTPLLAAPSDWACTMAGAGALRTGRAVAYLGTGGALGVATDGPRLDPQRRLSCLPTARDGLFGAEGLLVTGAASYGWLRETLAVGDSDGASGAGFEAMERLARAAPPGSRGLLTLPAFEGSGAPLWDADARGTVIGIGMGTTRSDLVRSMMEGVAMELRSLQLALSVMGATIERLTLTGPPAGSPTWGRIVSDVLGVPVRTVHPADPTMIGAAAVAASSLGLVPGADAAARRMTRHGRSWRPERARTRRYQALAALADDLGRLLAEQGISRRLAELRKEGT